ncbi:Raf kinase inhibitor-like YbhB/YbcL family protein [Xanthomonas arboricola]|uniref:YbhB/YbcL family Raf kinase inhibitor-like protein n=1 Tax=Xanthomonas TaxID=338 RepID=UPI000CEE0C63|nr:MULTISPECIES: YbhB/YbcL family Raf kinase inhibitor-like protein [Xanthomonas]MBB5734876.1 Raf kinase inhibitor-like YbhB/YbcL family protein [Xanthomonas sp. CFBP 8152]PPT80832.1 PEBP family protein [Xanthomonas arboricola]
MRRILSVTLLGLLVGHAHAQQGDGTDVQAQVHTFKPDKVDATSKQIAGLKIPAGFQIKAFATGLKNARIIAVAPGGNIYVSRRDQGDILLLKDANDDGRLDAPPKVVASRSGAHGLAIRDGQLYLVTVKELFVAPILKDGTLGPLTLLVGDLPDGGQHPNRTMAFGPDGMLYLSIGSTCNACNETNPEHATMLRVSPDGKSRTIFASGLRNTIGFDWDPATGELWGMDQGIDFLGDEVQPEELNHLSKGKQYGWPHTWGRDGVNPQSTPQGEMTKQQWAAISEPMVMGYTAHAAAMQFHFYHGSSFPSDYRGDAFITFRGSWNRKPASGYEVVRVKFENGKPVAFEPFVTGFLTEGGTKHFARPVGLAETAGGALLVSDDANGVIYRISATGAPARAGAAAGQSIEAPSASMQAQVNQGNGVPLALTRAETDSNGTLAVTVPAFANGARMDKRFSDYADGVSPALSWKAVANAKSYVVIVEDPDAKPITPFVHWVAWNIPANVTRLPEGLQEQMRLTEPEGVLQGTTSRGSVGYYGPHPPVGDPPHHYHFQVFALDTMLDVKPGATRDQILAAASGHVLAKGETVGTYAQAVAPLK